MTTGSVRGKCEARHSGQRRTQPAEFNAGLRAALGAEAVPRVPVDQRARLGENRRLAARQQRRQCARVERLACRRGTGIGAARIDRETRPLIAETEKDQRRAALDQLAPRRHLLPVERRRAVFPGQWPQVAQRQYARRRIGEQRGHPFRVAPPLAGAVERVAGKAVDVFHNGDANRRNRDAQSPPLLGSVLIRPDQHLVPLETRSTSTASPAKAGTHALTVRLPAWWIPAFAGMTSEAD